MFQNGEKLDMSILAKRLGIGRATLYRWIGDKDRLVVDLMWSLNELLFESLLKTAPKRGVKRINHFVCGVIDAVVDSDAYKTFLEHEGLEGLALMTSTNGLHGRIVGRLKELALAEVKAKNYSPPADLDILVEAAVALVEHFLYSQFVVRGFEPEAEGAKTAVKLLLRENRRSTGTPR